MKRIKTMILLFAGVLLLTSCNFNDIFEPILEIPEVPTAEFSERPTNELITEEKTSETDEPEEELIMYFDPSLLLSDSVFQGLDFSETTGKEFSYIEGEGYDFKSFYDENKNGEVLEGCLSEAWTREAKVTYSQSYKIDKWENKILNEYVGEDARWIEAGGEVVLVEDLLLKGEELGYRPTEEYVIDKAIYFANCTVEDFQSIDDKVFQTTVVMNPITEEGGEYDGAGTVYFRAYVHGMKTNHSFCIKFNCDGEPYMLDAISTLEKTARGWYWIDEEELQAKSQMIDDTFGKDYTIGEKVLIYKNNYDGYYITTEISRTNSDGNNISTRIYIPVETNDNLPF